MLDHSLQYLQVKASGPHNINGILQGYQRAHISEEWVEAGFSFPVVLGKKGLAPIGFKKEGDHLSPQGIFPVLSIFSSMEMPLQNPIRMPWIFCKSSLVCVDDPHSKYYNQIVDEEVVLKDWTSAERMLRSDLLYKYGLVLGYNTPNPVPGAGSAIFVHIWRGPEHGTEGCVAMAESNILQLIRWLDADGHPMLSIGL